MQLDWLSGKDQNSKYFDHVNEPWWSDEQFEVGQSWWFAAIIDSCLSVLPSQTLYEMADEEAVLKKKVKLVLSHIFA